MLDLRHTTVTIDAMGCQKDIATGVVARKADYLLAVKGNQEGLRPRLWPLSLGSRRLPWNLDLHRSVFSYQSLFR